MYKNIEFIYLQLRNLFSILFESMTCRTKPYYQQCNYEEEDNHPNTLL